MKKCVIVGCSGRGLCMFARPIARGEIKGLEIAGAFDINSDRTKQFSSNCYDVKVYEDFEKMLGETKPDYVIVATTDRYHHEYIIRALDMGVDVVTEKPMTINREYAKQIMEVEKRSGKKVFVTFNMRFAPYNVKIKELIINGAVGKVQHVHCEWFLDKSHGADYFRRWHRYLENSGGLLIHKSTHHFDLVNWLIDKKPISVFARGDLKVYGKNGSFRGVNCRTCEHAKKCPYYYDIQVDEAGIIRDLHISGEKSSGYLRDACVFAEDINIYDTMSVSVQYEDHVTLNYSQTAYNPYEGWKMSIIGDEGRLEVGEFGSGMYSKEEHIIKLYKKGGEETIIKFPKIVDGHGGGDIRLRNCIFGDYEDNGLNQLASSYDGFLSLAIGDCANQSILSGKEESIL